MNAAAPMPLPTHTPLNRADGKINVRVKPARNGSAIDTLYQSGAYKAVFPRASELTCVLVNTSGGITGGDRFRVDAEALSDTSLCLTTQAAERAYRARAGERGTVRTRLTVRAEASLRWLPQETILFDGCALDRSLRVDLEREATALIVEPLILGRAAMGETKVAGAIQERIEIWRDGAPLYVDRWTMQGNLHQQFMRSATGNGATAMTNIVLVNANAEAVLPRLRALLPETGGASLRAPDMICARLLAKDGYHMRRALLPILDLLTGHSLPTCWRL